MINRILVPTDGSTTAAKGVRYAVALAKKYKATLLGLHIVDVKLLEGPFLRDLSASLGTAPYVNFQGEIARLLEERGREALDAFRSLCVEAGVPCDATLVTGVVPRVIAEHGGLADLIVMGRGGEHNQWLEGLIGSTTEAVVRRAGQAVLVTGTDTPGGTRFVVAYDGSLHARHALKTAAAIAEAWDMSFDLLTVGGPKARSRLDEAKGYLQAHAVDVEYVAREGESGEAIVAYARECGAGLIVMGAYGHSKMRELVVGSTTTYAINHSPCPVLLSR